MKLRIRPQRTVIYGHPRSLNIQTTHLLLLCSMLVLLSITLHYGSVPFTTREILCSPLLLNLGFATCTLRGIAFFAFVESVFVSTSYYAFTSTAVSGLSKLGH